MSEQSPAPEPWQLSEEELAAEVLACEENLRREHGRMLQLVAEADQRGVGVSLGYRDTVSWLRLALRLSTREAKTRVDHATAVMPGSTITGTTQACELQDTGQALVDGNINREHVAEIRRVFARCPGHITAEQRAQAQDILLELAGQGRPEAVREVGQRLVHYWDAEDTPPEDKPERPHPLRKFDFTYDRDGWMLFTGRLDPETAATLRGLFGSLAAPRGANPDGTPDERGTAERHGDALAEIINLAARADELSVQGGERAVLFLTVTLQEMENRLRDALLDIPGCTSAQDLQHLACQAAVIPAVFNAQGKPLYLGRTSRFANRAQRRALALRDKGCCFPGCTRKPRWCVVHHVRWWVRGGKTNIDEMILVCEEHHRVIHHSEWEVRMTGGRPEFIPPPWLDPQQTPLRNTAHDIGPPGHRIQAA